ncbi:MAG: hypothetical protein KatS3mg051_1588 [Anaerolineae bacterium]|nr:MAG: hypothetical protein KatS3mg051_1588 [Anaerolineae bacterium]
MIDFAGGIGRVLIKEHPRGIGGLVVDLDARVLLASQRLPRVDVEEELDAAGLPVRLRATARAVLVCTRLSGFDLDALRALSAAGTPVYVDYHSRRVVGGAPWWIWRLRAARVVRAAEAPEVFGRAGRYEIELAAAGVTDEDLTWYNGFPAMATVEAASGGQGETITTYEIGTRPGWVRLDYEMFQNPDQAQLIYDGQVVADTGGLVSGPGTLWWEYVPQPGAPTVIDVRIYAPNSGTAWEYTFYGPDPDDGPV